MLALFISTAAFAGDEQWDSRFFEPSAPIRAFALASNGDLLCGGKFTGVGGVPGTSSLARWDGRQWSSVSPAVIYPGTVYAIAVNGTDIYVGGSFTSVGGLAITNLARWDGSEWHAVGDGVTGGTVRALAFKNGMLFVGGTFTQAGTLPAKHIAAWDGVSWSDLGGGISTGWFSETYPPVNVFAVAGDALYLGGKFYKVGGVEATNIARWDGARWLPLANGVTNPVTSLAPDGSGDLFVGMSMDVPNAGGLITKWDGANWSALNQGLYRGSLAVVTGMHIQGTNLYVCGGFVRAGALTVNGFARWDGADWHAVDAPLREGASVLAGDATNMYAVGTLTSIMANNTTGLAQYDGQTWSTVGLGLAANAPAFLDALAVFDDKVLLGGLFAGQSTAEWDGTTWEPLHGGLFSGSTAGRVYSFANAAGSIYAAGSFNRANATPSQGIAQYTGTSWLAMPGLGHAGRAVVSRGTEVFVGYVQGVGRWDGTNWSEIGQGLDGTVQALAVLGSDVYAGGAFTNTSNPHISNIARWDTNWHPLGEGLDGQVRTLAVYNRALYVGGSFTNANGMPAKYIAKWDGASWSPLGTGVRGGTSAQGPDESLTSVYSLAFSADGALYAGGNFTFAGDQPASFVAKWDGSTWSGLASGLGARATALTVHGADLYVGGDFQTAGGKQSWRFAHWAIGDPLLCLSVAVPSAVSSGSSLGYTLTLRNPQPVVATDCKLLAKVPAGTTFAAASEGGTLADGTVTWLIGDLGPGTQATRTLSVVVNATGGHIVLDEFWAADSNNKVFRGSARYTSIQSASYGPENFVLRVVGAFGGETLSFEAQGIAGITVALQASTNLMSWTSLSTNSFSSGPISFTETVSPGYPTRFYRLLVLP
jgi:hypothetical protein